MMINEVNMKKFLFIVALLVQQIDVLAVTVETTTNLNVYYPEYTKIDLICGQMPKASQKDVEFCCEAAFTGELLNEFRHSNIADNHICNGVMKKGYRCKANTGGFVWGKGKWQFMRKADYPTEANGWNMGFCQLLIIKDSAVRPIGAKMKNNRLKIVLAEKERTGTWLSEQMGHSISTVSRWMTNKVQPSVEQLYEIARHLDVDVKELLVSSK